MLTLSIKRKPWRGGKHASSWFDKEFNRLKASKKKADNYTCIHCRLKSEKYQESHHMDNDHTNNDPSNLATICPLCHSCHHVGIAGMQNRGFLVWLPEWKQEHLNRYSIFMQFIINTTEDNNPYNIKASDFFEDLSNRHELLKKEIGEELSDAARLARYMQIMDDTQYNQRMSSLKNIRLAPNFNCEFYQPRIEYWTKMLTENLPVGGWESIVEGASL